VRATVVIPTRGRPSYLAVALRSVLAQADDVVVVLDGPDPASDAVARAAGARVVAHDAPRGLNAARNTGLESAGGDLVVYVDDDVEVRPSWLEALLAAAEREPDVDVFTGPVFARFEDHAFRTCGREGPPVTFLDLGPVDADAPHAWGANLAIRRSAFDRVGPFDAGHWTGAGDEQEWLDRHGGTIRYVAEAALDHRRAGDDARLGALARAAFVRGRTARRFDMVRGAAPSLTRELRVLAGSLLHGPRFRCMNGPVLAAHAAGRVQVALRPGPDPRAPDYLSGRSGTVGGRRRALRAAADRALDVLDLPARGALAVAARRAPRRRVLVLSLVRPEHAGTWRAAERELTGSRHDVTVVRGGVGTLGKFENLNALLAEHPPGEHDWLLVVDDDVALPRGFLDAFLVVAERLGLKLAQPAHRLDSHAAWPVTRRRPFSVARETSFVEIGPVTAFHRDAFGALLPFPALRMGWGLDVHWAARAREQGWRVGVVDATPVAHLAAPAAAAYSREEALREAEAFLDGRPYVRRDEADRTLATHRRLV
jgi:GT2 family glycosyltransferase